MSPAVSENGDLSAATRRFLILLLVLVAVALGGTGGCGRSRGTASVFLPSESTTDEHGRFRAIAGVSVGAFGAMNLGTKYPHLFGVVGSLGGPIDLTALLQNLLEENLEVKPQKSLPPGVDADFTFDHFPSYPDRDSRIAMLKDLFIALGNPFLHHEDPSRRYLARDSQPASIRRDDVYGFLTLPADPRGFFDGGDENSDGVRQLTESPIDPTDVLLLAAGSVERLTGRLADAVVGGRGLTDLTGDGVFDVGDAIVLNFSEFFTDRNENQVFDPHFGELFLDSGLDGVVGSGDYGENNGKFDYDPDRRHWIAEDPVTRLRERDPIEIKKQRFYMDVGTEDEFGLEEHYLNMVALLESKGIPVDIEDVVSMDCLSPRPSTARHLLLRYRGGHLGFSDLDDLRTGDFCGTSVIWFRIVTLIRFLDDSFPQGVFGPGGANLVGDTLLTPIPSPILAVDGGAAPLRRVLLYRPPAHFNTEAQLPIVYFLGGYGQDPADYARVRDLMALLILTGQVQNLYFVFLPGSGGVRGTFHVNDRIPANQVPGLERTSGRYEDSIVEDLIPTIENIILAGRIKQ